MPVIAETNLTSGEVSPTMEGRSDTARYPNACVRLENFLLTTTGMYSARPGMGLMGLPKSAGTRAKLRNFQFSDQQGNILELGELYARVWNTLGQVLQAPAGPPVEVSTPFPAAELDLLGYTQSADFLFVVHENRGIFTIKRLSLTNWQFASFPLSDGPYGAENADQAQTLAFSALGGSCTVTAAGVTADSGGGAPFLAGDENRLIRVRDGSSGGNPVWRWLIVTAVIDSQHATATWQNGPATSFAANAAQWDWRLGIYSDRLGWPKAAMIHEQRLVLAGPASLPDRIDGSQIAGFNVFAPTDPLVDDGAYAYALGSQNVNRVLGLAVSNDLVVMTAGSEHHVAGDSVGSAITPSAIWQKPISPDGAKAGIAPVQAYNATVFIDKYGLNMRAITYDFRFQNYAPDNLTEIADHMAWLDPDSPGFQALLWQANPFGNLWTIRGNGELAGAIYQPVQNVLGFHRHPMGSAFGEIPVVESIEILKGPTYDELWAVVRRDLPGRTLRTIERMGRPGLWDTAYTRQCRLDSSLSLRNTPTADLVLAAVSGNAVNASLANVTGGFAFAAGDVGRFVKQRYLAGYTLRGRPIWQTALAQITAYTSPTQVVLTILVPFPATTAAAGAWGLTVAAVTGLDHLEGLTVTAVSDGNVCRPQVVQGGRITLDVPGWEVSAGLRFTSIMVTLPIDPGPSPVIGQGRQARIETITARMLNSIGGEFCSVPETDAELPRWDQLCAYNQAQAAPSAAPVPFTGDRKIWTAGEWTRKPQFAIRQADPLPLNVQLALPHVYAPFIQP